MIGRFSFVCCGHGTRVGVGVGVGYDVCSGQLVVSIFIFIVASISRPVLRRTDALVVAVLLDIGGLSSSRGRSE